MLKRLEVVGFKSFAKKTALDFSSNVTAIVGPNGSGKSNVAEAFRFALGEQSMKSMRGRRAEDLIWGGSHSIPRASRAGVAIVFDNPPRGGKRPFDIDFDEVTVERVVMRDGTSEYSINSSRVRLRDVAELLASATIGETEHHIISQGEADRILLSSARERRTLVEDALGLRLYEFKKREAEGKLTQTEENVKEVNALRRELAPHLKFLARQVEKLDRTESLRQELVREAHRYFAAADARHAAAIAVLKEEVAAAREVLAATSAEFMAIEEAAGDGAAGKRLEELRVAERVLEELRSERTALAHEIGKVEGALAAAKERSARAVREPYAKVPREELSALSETVTKETGRVTTLEEARAALIGLAKVVAAFVSRFISPGSDLMVEEERVAYALGATHEDLLGKDRTLAGRIGEAETKLRKAREALAAHSEGAEEERRHILELAQKKAHGEAEAARLEARERERAEEAAVLTRLKAEAVAIAGREALSYTPLTELPGDGAAGEEHKRALERLIIRLEEAGGSGEEVRAEHKEATERETFLAHELADLERSAEGLRGLIHDLDEELTMHFAEGLAKVNASFDEFFKILFGGGAARLSLEEPAEAADAGSDESVNGGMRADKPGLDIAVSLPKKKIRGLIQLSGGERALTSIALIFAMSQVNPPPFLILDETDAALDEANSRRYGDIIENLAKHSQLIVITHNRETMSRAGILYGVTMGSDGVSKLLSVKFEDAMTVAK